MRETEPGGDWRVVDGGNSAVEEMKASGRGNYMPLNVIDKIHMYGAYVITENVYGERPGGGDLYGGDGRCDCVVATSLRHKTKQQVLGSCGPNGTSNTYKHSTGCLNQVPLGVYDSKLRDVCALNEMELVEKHKDGVEKTYVNINMCKGADEMLLFKQIISAYDGKAVTTGNQHYLTTCAATVVDPFTSVRNEISFSTIDPLNLIAKESFHANKKVVGIPKSGGVLSFRKKQSKKDKALADASARTRTRCGTVVKEEVVDGGVAPVDTDMIWLEMQFYDRNAINVSGQSCEHMVNGVISKLVSGMMLSASRGESKVHVDLFMANVKAEFSKYMGTMIPAWLNYTIEYAARGIGTHKMTFDQQMDAYRKYGTVLLRLLSPSRENRAQCSDFSFGRATGSPIIDEDDQKLVTLKYGLTETEDNFLLAEHVDSSDPRYIDDRGAKRKRTDDTTPTTGGGVEDESKRVKLSSKYTCKDLCNKRKRMQGLIKFWFSGSLRFRHNYDLDIPTEEEK
jgi:hypothetical protein